MAKFPLDPLFRVASREIRLAAARNFANSDYGKLIKEVERAYKRPTTEAKITSILRQYKKLSPRRTVEQIMGSDFASLARVVERYAKGGDRLPRAIVSKFLHSLGPAGNILKALAMSPKTDLGYRSSLNDAVAMIRAFGGEVWLPKGHGTVQDVNRAVEASIQRLAEIGYTATKIGEEGVKGAEPSPVKPKRLSEERNTVDLQMASGLEQRFGRNHPIVTGEMVPTPHSTNVYEFGYDYGHQYLDVRYKASAGTKEIRTAPGSLYRYAHVTPDEFVAIYKTRNGGTGEWIWDNLRQRGTVSGVANGHSYELVGIMDGYVPRQATVAQVVHEPNGAFRIVEKGGTLTEVFKPRFVKAHTGHWIKSKHGLELAPTSGFMVGERGAGGGPRSGRNSPRG